MKSVPSRLETLQLAPPPRPGAHIPRYKAERLANGGQTAEITLDDKVYTLRITRQGKLLLTK